MEPDKQPDFDSENDGHGLSAQERANQRWGISPQSGGGTGVYDDKSSSAPNLKSMEGGGRGDGKPTGRLHGVGSGAESGSKKGLAAAETGAAGGIAGKIGHGFNALDATPIGRFARLGKMFWGSKNRKRASSGGVAGGITGIIIFSLLSISSGPAQLLFLAHYLKHPFSKVESDSSNRTNHLLRYAVALHEKNTNYTRLGLTGAIVMKRILANLADVGVTIETNSNGTPTDIGIDRSKIEDRFPETKGMSDEEFKNFLANKLSISSDQFDPVARGPDGSVSKFNINLRDFKFSDIKTLLKNGQVGLLGDGSVEAGLKTRVVGKFFGLSSLFHPFSRALNQKLNSRITAAEDAKKSEKAAEDQFEQDQQTSTDSGEDAKGAVVADEMQGDVDEQKGIGTKAIAIAGVIIAGACIAHETAEEIPKIDYYRVVAPAEIQAVNILAMASQVQSGQGGVTANQLGAAVDNFTNSEGQTVWQSAGINALEGNKVATNSKGGYENDLPTEDKQAFASQTTFNMINDVAENVLDGLVGPGELLKFFGVSHPGLILCNQYVQYGLAGISVIAQGIAAFFSGGASAVAVTGAETAESVVVQQLVIGRVIKMAQQWFVNSHTGGKLAKDAFSGPLGGNLLAYGARAAANVTAIASGGVSLGNSSSTLVGDADESNEQQLQHESFYARLFSTKSYQSLTNRMAMTLGDHGFISTVSSFADNLLHLGNVISGVLGSLLPNTSAAGNSLSGNFDWGFPQYGIPSSMLNDPSLADPYQNANNVGEYLTRVCASGNTIGPQQGPCSGDSGYTSRIKACFGNKLTYTQASPVGYWDVVPLSNVDMNPNSDSYASANCSDTSQIWRQITMWINDTSTMDTIACYQGDNQSCTDIGLGGADGDSTATPASATGS